MVMNNQKSVVLPATRGDYKERSDIDLAVYGGDVSRIALDIDEDTDTLLMFDIVDMEKSSSEELIDVVAIIGIIQNGRFSSLYPDTD